MTALFFLFTTIAIALADYCRTIQGIKRRQSAMGELNNALNSQK